MVAVWLPGPRVMSIYKGSPSSNCFKRPSRMQNKHLKHERSRVTSSDCTEGKHGVLLPLTPGSLSKAPSAPAWSRWPSQGKPARLAASSAVSLSEFSWCSEQTGRERGAEESGRERGRPGFRWEGATSLLGQVRRTVKHSVRRRGSTGRSLRPHPSPYTCGSWGRVCLYHQPHLRTSYGYQRCSSQTRG